MDRPFRVALICGACPLLVGCSIFFLWLFTRWEWLMIPGIFTLAAGPVICGFGFFELANSQWLTHGVFDFSPRRRRVATIGCGGLLLLNFPAAGAIVAAVITIHSTYTVVVHNASERNLDDVRVYGGGCDISFGSIRPQAVARRSFWIQDDGELTFWAVSGSITYSVSDFSGYVTNGQGGQRTVTVKTDGTISVTDE
jgi:hypothetical protein